MNNDNNNDGWKISGNIKKVRNKQRRQKKKKEIKIKKQKEKRLYTKQQKIINEKKKLEEEWRRKRIELIKNKEFENFKVRKISPKFAQAIQIERTKRNITRKKLATILMISEGELSNYENQKKCPSSQTIVKLRKMFSNLPRQYYIID